MAFPRSIVDGPTRAPLGMGLFSVLTPRPEGDGRWQGSGISWTPLTCSPAFGIGPVTCDENDATQTATGLPKTLSVETDGAPSADPITVYGVHSCSPVGIPVAEAEALAGEHLRIREEARVEQALWTGDLGNEPNLVGSTPDVLTPGAVSVGIAVALLEQWIATVVGSQGVVHMDRFTGQVAAAADVIEITSSGAARTRLRTPVVIGAGYSGLEGPAGEDTGTDGRWIFATPALVGFRSDVFTPSARSGDLLDRAQNDLYAVAERSYVVGWDACGTAAVQALVPPSPALDPAP